MHEQVTISIVLVSLFLTAAWVISSLAGNWRRARIASTVAEMHGKVIDRFQSNQDLIAYMETDAGRKFLNSAVSDGASPYSRILGAATAGILLTLLGTSLFLLRLSVQDNGERQGLMYVAAPVLALGIGFLAAAVLANTLCRKWGLFDKANGE